MTREQIMKLSSKNDIIIGGVKITHPNKKIESTVTITKEEIANYYYQVNTRILPYLKNRPLALLRCTEGETCFYQKHYNSYFPKDVHKIQIEEEKHKKADYITITNKKGLISLIQFLTIEIHIWSSHYTSLEKPDFVSFDLDPDPKLPWKSIIKMAIILRKTLENLKLHSFIKTTGGKGLHILVPLRKKATWEETKSFAHHVAKHLEIQYPNLVTTNPLKVKRKGKIFIDYLRNGRGALIVAPYSVRAKKDAPISIPITWEELPKTTSGGQYNISNIQRRLSRLKEDPWADFYRYKQTLPKF